MGKAFFLLKNKLSEVQPMVIFAHVLFLIVHPQAEC